MRVERHRGGTVMGGAKGLSRFATACGVAALTLMVLPVSGQAQTELQPPAFSGSAAAGGVRVTLTVPGAPATDTPVDGGGPTAQVAVDSIGTSTGYAAFPDPGQFILSVPGLAVGLLAGGAGPFPPIKLPSPPNYPFFIQSDASNTPEATAGSGPYQLSATSDSGSSKAQATSGFQSGVSGNAALATSEATLTSSADKVVAKAVADLQGLSIGPLTVGDIKSTATETMDSGGILTPSTNLEVAGLRVGGVPVELTPQGFVAGGPTYPVPLNPTLASLLKSSGITMAFVAAQTFPDRVVAPALQITFPFAMPLAVPNLGQFHGVTTVIIGSATAQMSGAAAKAGLGASTEATPGSTGQAAASTASSATDLGSSTAIAAPSGASSALATTVAPASAAPPSAALATPARASSAQVPVADSLDVRSVYLMVLAGALVALGLGQVIRRLGGRAWISMGG